MKEKENGPVKTLIVNGERFAFEFAFESRLKSNTWTRSTFRACAREKGRSDVLVSNATATKVAHQGSSETRGNRRKRGDEREREREEKEREREREKTSDTCYLMKREHRVFDGGEKRFGE